MAELERDGVFCRLVKVDVASHSPQTVPLAEELAVELNGLTPSDAHTPLWSTVLGHRAEGKQFDPVYWGRNLRETVLFTDAINGVLDDGVSAFVELGPHPVLLHSVAQTSQSRERQVALAACGRREDGDYAALLAALGQLWAAGYPIDWSDVLPKGERIVSLPTIHGNASVIGLPPRKYARRLRTREPSALQSIKNLRICFSTLPGKRLIWQRK